MLVFNKLVRYIIKSDKPRYSSNPEYAYNRLINSIKIGICSSYGKDLCVYTGYAIYTYNMELTDIKIYTELNHDRVPQYSYVFNPNSVCYTRYISNYSDYDMYTYEYIYANNSNSLVITKYYYAKNETIEIEYDYLTNSNDIECIFYYFVNKRSKRNIIKLKYNLDQLVEIVLKKDKKINKYKPPTIRNKNHQ